MQLKGKCVTSVKRHNVMNPVTVIFVSVISSILIMKVYFKL